jgi:hypothetical protein
MDKIISIALLIGGIILAILGLNASNSFSAPTGQSIAMLLVGIVAAVVGGVGLMRGGSKA